MFETSYKKNNCHMQKQKKKKIAVFIYEIVIRFV